MRKGYGRQLCSAIKNFRNCSLNPAILLPFIGGRDCCGIVEKIGANVKRFKKGAEVRCEDAIFEKLKNYCRSLFDLSFLISVNILKFSLILYYS